MISMMSAQQSNAQTLVIDSSFNTDGEIFPFFQNDTINGLSISGSITFNSDTSLVRVIISDAVGNEWMVYEAYPMIVSDTSFDIVEECDETCYLDEFIPYSLRIQITDALILLDSLNYSTEALGDMEALQYQAKRNKDLEKVQVMNQYINDRGWEWEADTTVIVNMYYFQKKSYLGEKPNPLGREYYSGGIFYSVCHEGIQKTNVTSIISEFDWRAKHNAHDDNSPYYDNDPIGQNNGWMTNIRLQQCESCAAYASVATLEAGINLYANYHFDVEEGIELSERDAFNCSQYDDPNYIVGCSCSQGKEIFKILNYLDDDPGIVNEDCYPEPDPLSGEPFCEGAGNNCEAFSSKCDDPLVNAKFSSRNLIYLSLYSTQSEREAYLKETLIKHGPLIVGITNWGYEPGFRHAVSLVGFEKDSKGNTIWILKNSWGYSGQAGYWYEPFHLGDDPPYPNSTPYIENTVYLIKYDMPDPIIVTSYPSYPIDYYVHEYDHDKDGYYNWGIGQKPNNYLCSQEEDSNDDENRVGPYEPDYSGRHVKPEMKVCWYKGQWQEKKYIENNSYFSFDQSDLNSRTDNTFIFRIENPGNAQLNLEILNTITSNNPDFYEVDIIDLDYEICMFDGYTEFTVKYYPDPQEANPIGVISIDVAEDDEDVIPDFTFYMVYYNCSPASGEEQINVDTTWDGFDLKTKDYRIISGITLTVTGTIGMAEGSDIFVEPGAKIIMDGGCLTGLCGKLWNGIDLWGNPLYSQDERDQGYAVIINGGSIEYAKKGIETAYFDGGAYHRSGGVVYCDSAFFKDNQTGIKFYPYHYSAPGGAQVPNFSRIKNTEFEITDNFYSLDYSTVLDPLAGLHIGEIWGLNILGCDFINSSDKTNLVRGNGIYSMNGGYFITKRCTDLIPQVPCSGYEICTFGNLDYGVRAFGDGSEWIIHIDTADFTENYRGVFMSGINDPIITRNTFNCSDELDRIGSHDPLAGAYLEYCNRYQVEENSFTSNYSQNGQDAVGIQIVNSCPYYNEVYNNAFNDFLVGITAAGENRDMYGTGLCIKCNDFANCVSDIYVTPDGGYRSDYFGIATDQGSESDPENPDPTLATGNTFSQDNGTNPNYTNEEGCNPIIYTYHGNNSSGKKIFPIPYAPPYPSLQIQLNPDGNVDYTVKDEVCPSHLEEGIALESEKNTIIESTTLLSEVQDTLELLVDGGDTESLDFEIQTSFPDEALLLRQELIDHSPYLSDTIIKSSIAKEDVLLNALLRDILVANPQVAKTPSILNKLDERNDPMPDYMMEEIMQGQNIYGDKEILESRLAAFQSSRDLSLSKVIRYYKTDTSDYMASRDSLRITIENEDYPSARYELAYLYLNRDDSLNTFASLENIPFIFDLTTDETNLHTDYETLFDLLWTVHTDTISLDSIQIEQLISLSESYSLPGIFARNVLVDNQLMYYNETVYLPDLNKSVVVNNKLPVYEEDETDCLKVFPNPSGNFFIVEYFVENESLQSSFLILNDMLGSVRKTWRLKDNQNQLIVPTNDLAPGTYLLQLIVDGKYIGNTKLIINKQ